MKNRLLWSSVEIRVLSPSSKWTGPIPPPTNVTVLGRFLVDACQGDATILNVVQLAWPNGGRCHDGDGSFNSAYIGARIKTATPDSLVVEAKAWHTPVSPPAEVVSTNETERAARKRYPILGFGRIETENTETQAVLVVCTGPVIREVW